MTRRSRRRYARALVVLLGVLTALVLRAAPAAAHATVIATTPSNGSEVQTPPTQILVSFSEPVTLPSGKDSAGVLDAEGSRVDTGSVRLIDGRRTLVIGVRPGVPKGTYIASWSVVSDDTHPVGGSIQFGYGVPAVALATSPSQQPSAGLQLFVGLANGLVSLGLVAALGLVPAGLLLGADVGERRVLWRAARVGAVLSILASILQIGAQYLWQASALPGGAGWSGLGAFTGSAYSATVFVRIGLLGAALVALPPWRVVASRPASLRVRWAGEALLAVAVLGTVVRNGHGGNGAWWQVVPTLVHVGAVVVWLGGLAVLGWFVLRSRLPVRRLRHLPRWSRYAATSVGLLALTGLLQGLVQVRHPAALISTTYGYVLLVKLLLVAAALLLGLWGNRWIARQVAAAGRRPPEDEDGRIAPGETARLRGRVQLEAGAGALIVVVSGLLSSVTPAAAAYAPQRVVDTTIGPYAVTIRVAPARRGPQSFRITAQGVTEGTAPARSIQLDLGLGRTAGAVRALPVTFPYRLSERIVVGRPTGFTFVSSSVNVPETGVWTGTLTVVAGPTQQYTADFTYRVV